MKIMNIYDEVLEKFIIQKDFDLILKALECAKKVEELLVLYQKIISMMIGIPKKDNYHFIVRYTDDVVFNNLLNQIKLKEKELEEMK